MVCCFRSKSGSKIDVWRERSWMTEPNHCVKMPAVMDSPRVRYLLNRRSRGTSTSNHATVLIATRGQSALLIYSEDKHILYILHIVILLCYGMAAMIFLQNFQFIALDGSGFKTVMHFSLAKDKTWWNQKVWTKSTWVKCEILEIHLDVSLVG